MEPRIVIIIPTYDRPDMLCKVLLDIRREMPSARVYVFNDGSKMDYSEAIKIDRLDIHYRPMLEHCGKKKFWKLVTYMFRQIKPETFDYAFFLSDDVRLKKGMLQTCINAYQSITAKDNKLLCLSVGHANDRAYKPCWTDFKPVQKKIGGIEVLKTQWNDLCFMAERQFFDFLNWEIPFIHPDRWKINRRRSTGVGKHISITIHKGGHTMYHIADTQVIFSNDNPSMMQRKNVLTSVL